MLRLTAAVAALVMLLSSSESRADDVAAAKLHYERGTFVVDDHSQYPVNLSLTVQ